MKFARNLILTIVTVVLAGCYWGPGYGGGPYEHDGGYDHGDQHMRRDESSHRQNHDQGMPDKDRPAY